MHIDLNADLGEGAALDAELMPLLSSANVCCGGHAGDAWTSLTALRLAAQHGVQVGAHPGYTDREHFGRRELALSAEEIHALIIAQVGALQALARLVPISVRYVKPHGALYNQACRDDAFARPIIEAVAYLGLAIMGLPGSHLEALARGRCLFLAEGFADRRYLADGSLVPRSQADAFITEPGEAAQQATRLVQERGVRSLCVHGDNPQALVFVRAMRSSLEAAGFSVQPVQIHG